MNNSHLWNNMPFEERKRLMPYQIEQQILHVEQVRRLAVAHHESFMSDVNVWLDNLYKDLEEK